MLAGCLGGESDEGGDDDGTGGDDGTGDSGGNGNDVETTGESTAQSDQGGSFDCADLTRGSQVFDPDGREFQVVWDYPESFSDVEREIANSDSIAGARLGHDATKRPGSWAFIVQVNQGVNPTDADAADRYVNNPAYDEAEPI